MKEKFKKLPVAVLPTFVGTMTLGQVLDTLHAEEAVRAVSDVQVNEPVTVGAVVDFLKNNEALKQHRDRTISLTITLGEIFDLFGEENVKEFVEKKTAAAAYKPEYDSSMKNIAKNWLMLCVFAVVFAIMATIVLELIDKDKR